MQEINLLNNRLKDTTHVWEKRNQFLTTIFTLVLILEIGLGLVFFLLTQGLENRIKETVAGNNALQKEINQAQNELSSAKSFQAQLKNIKALLDNHIYWSSFFEEMSDFTLNSVTFNSFQGSLKGKIHL